jgi:hypothetical protein
MTAWRQAIELSIGDEDVARLVTITRSRTGPASRVEQALMLLAYRKNASFFAVAHALCVHHQTVQRCVERALAYGSKEPTITAEAKAWLVSLACRKAKELGYLHELWTTRLLARHAREHGPAEGHLSLVKLVQSTVCKILNGQEVKPHKVARAASRVLSVISELQLARRLLNNVIMAFVVSGTVTSKVGDGPEQIFHAGDAWWEPPGAINRVSRNASSAEPARLLAIYIAPGGATATDLMKPI